MQSPSRDNTHRAGFTLIELTIVVSIMAILSAIAVPRYQSAVSSARITKAQQELRIISMAVQTFMAKYGELPEYLEDVKYGNKLDPWGNPYGYLNFASGTGNGMDWAVEQGLVDTTVFSQAESRMNTAVARVNTWGKTRERKNGKRFKLHNQNNRPMVLAEVAKVRRRDRALFPINSDFDLFSLGPNGTTDVSLTTALSLDDVIRANDGQFFGQASDY